MPRYGDDPSVSAVMPVHDPNLEHMAWSLDRLEEQDYPIRELIVVDSSPAPVSVEMENIPVEVVRAPDTGIAEARALGLQRASGDLVVDMDEDAVFLADDYISRAVEAINSGASAAGGVVVPMRGNLEGRVIAFADRFNPTNLGTHNLVYPRRVCLADGTDACFPMEHRGEDLTIRRELKKAGPIQRMNDQPILKDLPTTRQELGRNTIIGTIIGGVIAGIGTSIADRIVSEVQEEGTELYGEVAK